MQGTCVIPHFMEFFTGKSIYSIILVIEGHLQGYLQGQKVNSKVKVKKIWFLTNTNGKKSNIYVWCDFYLIIHFSYYFDD